MAASTKNIAILYLDKNRFDLYLTNNPTALSIVFTAEVTKDIEVMNTESLTSQITTFIEQNKLSPAPLITILSENITFFKEFPASFGEKQEEEIQKFLDSIPFEHISAKIYPLANDFKVVATNRDYYETIKDVFTKHGFPTLAVIPSWILTNVNTKNGLDPTTRQFIIEKFESLKQFSLLLPQNTFASIQQDKTNSPFNPKNIRLTILLAIFILLILILVIVAIITFVSKPPAPKATINTSPSTPTTIPIPTQVPSLEIAPPATPSALPQITP